MRVSQVRFVALAALLVASVAFAAKQSATADISQLGASGISGKADFALTGNGAVKVHESLSGLTPGVEYTSLIYSGSSSCGSGTSAVLATFTANAAGKANINVEAPVQINPLQVGSFSISVQNGTTVMACGEIVQQ